MCGFLLLFVEEGERGERERERKKRRNVAVLRILIKIKRGELTSMFNSRMAALSVRISCRSLSIWFCFSFWKGVALQKEERL